MKTKDAQQGLVTDEEFEKAVTELEDLMKADAQSEEPTVEDELAKAADALEQDLGKGDGGDGADGPGGMVVGGKRKKDKKAPMHDDAAAADQGASGEDTVRGGKAVDKSQAAADALRKAIESPDEFQDAAPVLKAIAEHQEAFASGLAAVQQGLELQKRAQAVQMRALIHISKSLTKATLRPTPAGVIGRVAGKDQVLNGDADTGKGGLAKSRTEIQIALEKAVQAGDAEPWMMARFDAIGVPALEGLADGVREKYGLRG